MGASISLPKYYPSNEDKLPKVCSVEVVENIILLRLIDDDNKINSRSIASICEALDDIERVCNVERESAKVPRALVTIGKGNIYSNGLSNSLSLNSPGEFYILKRKFSYLLARFLKFPIPTIAALNGRAAAEGAALAIAHDVRVMGADRGYFCMNEIDINIPLKHCLNSLFKAKVRDFQTYRDLILLGHRFTAEEALNNGLVDLICSNDELLTKSLELANYYASKIANGGAVYAKMRVDYLKSIIKGFEMDCIIPNLIKL